MTTNDKSALSQSLWRGLLMPLRSVVPSYAAGQPARALQQPEAGRPAAAPTSGAPARNLVRTSALAAAVAAPPAPSGAGPQAPDFGYARDLDAHYELGKELGRGGNGVVRVVRSRRTGIEFACKSIPKVLEGSVSETKKKGHADAIRREIEVMRRLRGTLNVACIEDVYEDDQAVHIVMEYCKGGELWHRIGEAHYSEQTVASYMRAVLRTLSQCHAHNILHRDVKPGNFMLLDETDRAPLKAIDFGLAVFFDPKAKPRSDLGLEGTPWFMAPEVLSSQVGPASDVWSAGVMAHQLLTGRFPFDDKSCPHNPALAKIWRSILTDQVNFSRSYWDGISDEAKDFVAKLLVKDPAKRPTAAEALQHPWLRGGIGDRNKGKPLSLNVVQRIQRYGQGSLFKRTVLQHLAEDLLRTALEDSVRGGLGGERVCQLQQNATPVVTLPTDSPMQYLYERLDFGDADSIDRLQLQQGLEKLGYRLHPAELERLMDQLDPQRTGRVARSQLAASIIDWGALVSSTDSALAARWLDSARRVFEGMDVNGDGLISTQEIIECLREKLPPSEIDAAVAQALEEASMHGAAAGLDFDAFLRLLRPDARDDLDQYEDRMGSSCGSISALMSAASEGSFKGGSAFLREASVKGGQLFHELGGAMLKEARVRGGHLVRNAMNSAIAPK